MKAQLPSIRACFGVQSPLVKIIDDSFVVRIVSLASDAEDLKEKLKAKLEEIYQKETRKNVCDENGKGFFGIFNFVKEDPVAGKA